MTILRALPRLVLLAVLVNMLGASLAWAVSDITVSKTGPVQALPGDDVTYTIAVSNAGPDGSGTITLTDDIVGGWAFLSITQTDGPSFSCSDPGTGATSGTVQCLGTLANEESSVFNIVFHIPLGTAPGTIFTNTATATVPQDESGPTDPNLLNNTGVAVTSTPFLSGADMTIAKTGPAGAGPDTDVAFTITVTNLGPDAASSVSWIDDLPPPMTFVSLTPTGGPAMSCTTGTTVTCTAASFPAGASATFTLTAHIPSGTPVGTTFLNSATVSTSTDDPNEGNNASTAIVITGAADVGVTASGPGTVTAGANINYTLTVTNAGSPEAAARRAAGRVAPASSVTLTVALPPNTTFVSLTQTSGPTFTCTTPAVGAGGTITCTIATLAPGESATFALVLKLSPAAPAGSNVSITATVTTTSPDPNLANNASTSGAIVAGSADVSVVKVGSASVTAGATASYGIAVTNGGPSDAASVSLTDTLPPGTTLASESQTSGPAFVCVTPAVGAAGTITCTIATLPAGGSATFAVVVNVAAGATGQITNTASVTATTPDSSPGNNTSSTTATVGTGPPSADLSIVKTAGARSGQSVTFTIVVTNNGPATALGVVMSDVILAGATVSSVSATQGTCTSGAVVTCTLDTLPVGASVTITLVLSFPTSGTFANTATVAGAISDPNPANNLSTAAVTLSAAAIPTLSPSTFVLLGIVFAAAGFFVLRRRRA